MTDVTFLLGKVPSSHQLGTALKVDKTQMAAFTRRRRLTTQAAQAEFRRMVSRCAKVVVGLGINQAEADLLAEARKAKVPIEYISATGDIHTD